MSYARLVIAVLAIVVLPAGGYVRAQDAPQIGLKIRTLTVELRKQHKLPDDAKGALVTAVTPGSSAQEKGIAVGEVIVEAGSKPVAAAKDVATQIAAASTSGGETIVFRVMNGKGERRDVAIPIAKRPAEASKPILPAPK
jgi:serine protease Do